MTRLQEETTCQVRIPGVAEPLSLALPEEIATLRERALALHRQPRGTPAGRALNDARAWAAHTDDEDWLIWRARRCAERLRSMTIDLEPGERIVGKPLFKAPPDQETGEEERAERALASMPPFPGGDAGHFHPDYEKLFRVGITGILQEIRTRASCADLSGEQRVFYEACGIALEGMSAFAGRVAAECAAMAREDAENAAAWRSLAAVCRRVATEPPATFHEAIQLLFLTLIALWFGEDHTLTAPGRLDQTLRPFYEADLAAGRTTPREAFALICCLYIQMNRIVEPGLAVSVMVGGRDAAGRDVTNALTYLCLAARMATKLVYPTVALAWHEGTPAALMDFCTRMLTTGIGDPAFFNDEVIARGLREHGVSEADCHNYMNSTCVEIKVVGASNVWVTQPYFNCPRALLEVMAEAAAEAGETGDATRRAPTCAEFEARVRENLAAAVGAAARRLDEVWRQREIHGGFPLASCFTADCLERGRDLDRGGARYNWVENSFVGLANLVDGLVAIKHLVYDRQELTLAEFHRILEDDFSGHAALRQRILNTIPKYGNDEDEPDAVAAEWAQFLIETTERHRVGPHRYVPGFFCWIVHERFGRATGATPDGRPAGWPLADGAGGAQGREKRGPTASALSTTRWSHRKALGGLVHNAKFPGGSLKTDAELRALRALIEGYLRRGGFEIQINVVGGEALRDAQAHPERYPDLLVRVAGYSDYFVHLNRNMQEEVIARTEHARPF